MSNVLHLHKYAYFVVNDSDDLEVLQNCLIPYGGVEAMKDMVIDYALDKRRILGLIDCCKVHDIIYTPYLARLGKSIKELYSIVQLANEKNIEIVFCDKPNTTFSLNNANGQKNFAVLKWAMELDFEIRSEYNKAHTASRKDAIYRKGVFVTNAELKCAYVGNPKWDDMSDAQQNALTKAQEASQLARHNAAIEWREKSQAVRYALHKYAEGWGVTQIAEELGKLYDDAPDVYCTPKGVKPTKGTVSKWLKEVKEKQSKTDNN